VLTEKEPLLVMTSNSCATGQALRKSLRGKGVRKFVAFEVPVDRLHEHYGVGFEVIAADIERGQELRVLDFDGPHIFDQVAFSELGQPLSVDH
jgi:hypothetical protein